VGLRRKAIMLSGLLSGVVAVTGLAGEPVAAGVVPTPPNPAACSTDIVGRGPGSAVGRQVEFSYTLGGGACRDAVYALIIRNTYDPQQVALFAQLGDGKSKDIFFRQDLPFTPTDPPTAEQSGVGLCVIGVVVRHLKIADIAPDPSEAPCEPLRGGSARAFH
jgi:hypothetical protein